MLFTHASGTSMQCVGYVLSRALVKLENMNAAITLKQRETENFLGSDTPLSAQHCTFKLVARNTSMAPKSHILGCNFLSVSLHGSVNNYV